MPNPRLSPHSQVPGIDIVSLRSLILYTNKMHLSVGLLSCLAALTLAAPQAIDYGPCDYNGNPHCKEIMDNTACFLNPVGADEIFNCISGGRDGVC